MILSIIIAIFSFATFICALIALISIRKNGRNNIDNLELYKNLTDFKSEIIEKVNDKNMSFLNDIKNSVEGLKDGNREILEKINLTLNNGINDIFEKFNSMVSSVNQSLLDNRTEIGKFRDDVTGKLAAADNTLNNKITIFQQGIFEKFGIVSDTMANSLSGNRMELNKSIEDFKSDIKASLSVINKTLEDKISLLQQSNEEKLEKMRGVVEERLEKTLNDRLKLSFESVRQNLEMVQRGLGEMQNLAADVGGLKRAITNVKTRGVFGEVQLERILEQILTPAQYEKNFQVKPNSQQRVEFAVKLPGKNTDQPVHLAIDAKFPSEDYEILINAYDSGDKQAIDRAKKSFVDKIKSFAKDISDKYIEIPITTDFAILFLPFEGLFAEVVQTPGLFDELRQKYKIIATGPTTLSALLNALQMGFQTIAIEKRSSEVWNILGAVKTEFGKFEEALKDVQKSLHKADNDLSTLVGTRTNAINRKLKSIQELSDSDSRALLPDE